MYFTVVTGKGQSGLSAEVALDDAMVDAGLGLVNVLTKITTIYSDCNWRGSLPEIEPGQNLSGTLAHCETLSGEAIAAIGWAVCQEGSGKKIRLVATLELQYAAEDEFSNDALRRFIKSYQGNGDAVEKYIKQALEQRLTAMAQRRSLTIVEVMSRIVRIAAEPQHHVAAVAALVISE